MKKRLTGLLLAVSMLLGLLSAGALSTSAQATWISVTTTIERLSNATVTISTKEKLPQYLSASDGALRAETVGEMEKFRVVQCADDSFAIRSERTGEYLSAREEKDSDGETGIQFCFDREFIESTQEKFRIISLQADTEPLNGDNYDGHYRVGTAVPCHIQSVLNNEWLACDSGGFLTTVMDLADAGEFFVSVKSHNNDSQEELDILHNSGWLNLDHSGVGYWNVQSELGSGSVASLKKLGYQPMHWSDQKTTRQSPNADIVKIGNMECAIGTKWNAITGAYDVLLAFQGTGGYGGGSGLQDALANTNNKLVESQHAGYRDMAYKLINERDRVKTTDGKSVTLEDLIVRAAEGNAHFTVLGHSMGGAIAQCFALYLTAKRGVEPAEVRGRTFESALALASEDGGTYSDEDYARFVDWYNLCVDSDSVPNGTVTCSIKDKAGLHRLGYTVWLSDPKPDEDFGKRDAGPICEGKHNMNGVLETLLRAHTAHVDSQSYIYQSGCWEACPFRISSEEGESYTPFGMTATYVTKLKSTSFYRRPNASAASSTKPVNTEVRVTGYVYDTYGRKWLMCGDGSFVQSDYLRYKGGVSRMEEHSLDHDLYVVSETAEVHSSASLNSMTTDTLRRGDAVHTIRGFYGGSEWNWYYVQYGSGKVGWVDGNQLSPYDPDWAKQLAAFALKLLYRLSLHCPVDVTVCDAGGKTVLCIEDNVVTKNDSGGKIVPLILDDEKQLYFYDDAPYQIRIKATDYDTFTYLLQSFHTDTGTYSEAKLFDYVDLEPGKTMTSSIGGTVKPTDVSLLVLGDNGAPVSTVAANGEETPISGKGTGTSANPGTADPAPAAGNPAPAGQTAQSGSRFADVPADAWYRAAVDEMLENGIMAGTSSGAFSPETAMSRAMLVTVLWRLAGKPTVDYALQFSDVPADAYYTEAVRWAASCGIAAGYGGRFGPDDPVTREQLAAILCRYAAGKGLDVSGAASLDTFADGAAVSDYAKSAVAWAVNAGLIKGSGGRLLPSGGATRAQVAAILSRFCKISAS